MSVSIHSGKSQEVVGEIFLPLPVQHMLKKVAYIKMDWIKGCTH